MKLQWWKNILQYMSKKLSRDKKRNGKCRKDWPRPGGCKKTINGPHYLIFNVRVPKTDSTAMCIGKPTGLLWFRSIIIPSLILGTLGIWLGLGCDSEKTFTQLRTLLYCVTCLSHWHSMIIISYTNRVEWNSDLWSCRVCDLSLEEEICRVMIYRFFQLSRVLSSRNLFAKRFVEKSFHSVE